MTMVLGMSGLTAFAATLDTSNTTSYSIEITPPTDGGNADTHTYTIYKVFDAVQSESGITYKLPSGITSLGAKGTASKKTIADYFEVENGDVKLIENSGATKLENGKTVLSDGAIAAITAFVNANKDTLASATATTTGKNATTVSNVPAGYYYVTTTTGSVVSVDSTNVKAEIKDKNTIPSVVKKQNTSGANQTYSTDSVNVQVGDTIYYEADVFVPATVDKELTLVDTMSAGLTPSTGTPTFKTDGEEDGTKVNLTLTADTDYTFTSGKNGDSDINGFTLVIKPTDNTKGKHIYIQYSATVNSKAIVDTEKQNGISLTYDNNTSSSSTTNYKIYATGAIKYDEATGKVDKETNILTNAEGKTLKYLKAGFKLYSAPKNTDIATTASWTEVNVVKDNSGYYRPAVSGEKAVTIYSDETSGQIIIRGLDSDKDYKLVETETPAGYTNISTNGVKLTVNTEDTKKTVALSNQASLQDDDNTRYVIPISVLKIANTSGTELPSTGGMGTTIFYVLGAALVIGAGVVLVTRRRLSK